MRKINENGKEITAEKLEELKANARGILAEHRRAFINEFPFYGTISLNMDIVPTRDVRVPTACCDGKTIYFDIDFLSSLAPENVKFVIAHECMHAVMNHPMRCESREHKNFNIAADIEVNQILLKDGLSVLESACLPKKFRFPDGLSAEEYYELLLKKEDDESEDRESPDGDQNSDGGMNGGFGGSMCNGSSMSQSGNSAGKLEGQFDKHMSEGDDIYNEPIPDNVCDKYGKVGVDKDFKPEVCKNNGEKMREAAITAAQEYERQRGELPAHLKKFVQDLMTPEIKWTDVMQAFITRTIGDKADWNRPNRRFVSSGTYLPSHDGEKVKVGVILDTSGSTSSDMKKFLSEVNGLVRTFDGYTLSILQCDAEVKSCKTYDEEDPLDLESEEFEVEGGGGTAMLPAFKHIEENEIEADCIVVFTDGYIDDVPEDAANGIPVLWVICKDGIESSIKFGEVVKFNN